MSIHFAAADYAVIALYFGAVLLVGFLTARKSGGITEYLLAGRSLTTPVFVMTLVSTWYGGILGVGEFSYSYGISNWVIQGVPYYIFAFIFALVLARRIRATNFATIPDKLQDAYGRPTAVLGALLTFILMTPAPYILMIAVMLELVTGWSLLWCIVLGTLATTAYLYAGGFRSDVNTDILEFFLMFVGFAVILPFAWAKFGGWDYISTHVPPLHLTWNGGNPVQFVIVWFFIALWTLVDPSFHQRCYAAKTPEVARRGILISIFFWLLFDAMTATAGLYARAALPDLPQAVMAYPMLAEVTLPPAVKGLFYVGMLATIMSTLNTLAFVSATTLGRDIIWRLRVAGPGALVPDTAEGGTPGSATAGSGSPARAVDSALPTGLAEGSPLSRNALQETLERRWTQRGLFVAGGLSIVLAWFIPSVIKLWYAIGTVVIPGLLVPLVTSYFPRYTVAPRYAFLSMLLGWLTSLAWLLAGWSQQLSASASYPLGIEPMYPGLLVSLVIWAIGKSRPARPGAPEPAA